MVNDEDIRRIVEKFKNKNGNNNFSNKDLIITANHNIEKLGEKLDKHIDECISIHKETASNKTSSYYHKWLIGILFTIDIFIVSNMIGLIGSIMSILG